jgi:two-component system, LytTR family, sensor kinase
MNFRKPAVLAWTFAIFTAIGIFFALHQHLDDVLYNPSVRLAERFLYELSGSWSAMLLIPLLNRISLGWPLTRRTIAPVLGVNVAGYAVYALGHTTLNDILRFVLAPVFGVAGVSPIGMLRELPSEAANDVVYYFAIMGTLYLINRFVKSQELEAHLAEAKLENLRLQLHPHFLFNTLNAVSAVMYEDVERADAMLSKLSDFLRRVLDSGSVHEVGIDEELDIERMYVDIMTTRLERKLRLSVNVADDARDSAVPFMLLQPLIENSIRHGMGSSRDTLAVDIAVTRDNGQTVITVDDDGLGIDPKSVRGIGLNNVSSRLSYMYGAAARFDISPRESGGTRAVLSFPCAAEAAS